MYLYGRVPIMIVAFALRFPGDVVQRNKYFVPVKVGRGGEKSIKTLPKMHSHSSPGRTPLYLVVRTPTVLPAFTRSDELGAYQQS